MVGGKEQLPSLRLARALKLDAAGNVQPHTAGTHAAGSATGASGSYVAALASLQPRSRAV